MLLEKHGQEKPGDEQPTYAERELHTHRLLIESLRDEVAKLKTQLEEHDGRLCHLECWLDSEIHDRLEAERSAA